MCIRDRYKVAASLALKNAAKKCGPVLLEPIMAVEVTAPSEYLRLTPVGLEAVSYTHLDVYKRQVVCLAPVNYRRRVIRLVSCYALFKGWLLLSQPPSCLYISIHLPCPHVPYR